MGTYAHEQKAIYTDTEGSQSDTEDGSKNVRCKNAADVQKSPLCAGALLPAYALIAQLLFMRFSRQPRACAKKTVAIEFQC